MQKVARRIITLLSLFLISTIGLMALVYVEAQIELGCGTVSPKAICGTDNMLTENGRMGRNLFNSNCAACHKLYKKAVGPALKGVLQRNNYYSNEYFYTLITNEQELIDQNDEYSVSLRREYNFNFKHQFKLSNKEIEQLMEYLHD